MRVHPIGLLSYVHYSLLETCSNPVAVCRFEKTNYLLMLAVALL